jgi:IS5 family transposase
VIERRHRQRSVFEAAVGPIEKLVEGLTDRELERLDQILTDEKLVEVVVERLARRRPQSRTRGRRGTPAEVALRMLVLKRLKGWSFEETEREVRRSLVYRHVARVYFERVPDSRTLIRLSGVIGPEGVEAIHHRLVELAREEGVINGRRGRVDTTVVETNVHYPTDSGLLGDGVRVLTRWMKRIEEATGVIGRRVRDRARATTHRMLEIGRAARSRAKRGKNQARQRLENSYRRLLALVRATVRDAQRVVSEIVAGVRVALTERALLITECGRIELEQMVALVRRVIEQTRARVFGGDTHYPGKLLSVFEPHTEAIRKGKASKPTEFGKLVKIQEAERQIVIDYEIYEHRPEDCALLLPAVATHTKTFGRPPQLLAADRGFWSRANKRAAKAAGVTKVCVPAQGRLSAEERAEQHSRWFRRGQRFRTGCEGRISVLKRRDGLGRCRYRGMRGMRRWVGWGVVSNNLWVLVNKPAK